MDNQYEAILGDKYLVSRSGDVYNVKTRRKLKPSSGLITMYDEEKNKVCIRHNRLIAETFIDNPNNYDYVMPIDGDYENCSADNLRWTPRYYKSYGCLVFFDITGTPIMFKNYADFKARTGHTSHTDIAKLIRGEIDNLGEYYSKTGMEKMMAEHLDRKDITQSKKYNRAENKRKKLNENVSNDKALSG